MSRILSIKRAPELIKEKEIETYLDKTLCRYLIKEFQKLSSDVGAIVYPEQNLVCFFYNRIIFYKVLMNEEGLDKIKVREHVARGAATLKLLKLGLIPYSDLRTIKAEANKIDFSLGKKL